MSLLEDIQKFSRNELKSTVTVIHTQDGRQLIEKKNSLGRYSQQQVSCSELGFVGDYKPDMQVGEVIPGLCIGSQDVAADLELLKSLKITHILNVAGSACENVFPDLFTYLSVNILDLPDVDITQYFPPCFDFINSALDNLDFENKVLVHCNAGVSRCSTVVIAYLIKTKKVDFEKAFDLVKSKRGCVRPNDGFLKQLKNYKPFL